MNQQHDSSRRREFLGAAGAAFTTSLFTGRVKGANDRIAVAHIGLGSIGMSSFRATLSRPDVAVTAVCDLYQPFLDKAAAATNNQVRTVRDFREILADKSIDAVSVNTPNHWHAYMTVEACKAGKDVYVEKPLSYTVEEGALMVKAARKYNRVVQAGTWQRSAPHFQKVCEIVRSGQLGKVEFVRTWNYINNPPEGFGIDPGGPPPSGFDWDMWLGPAPKRPYTRNRVGRPGGINAPCFHWYWDYGGGQVTNWGPHWLDIVQMAFGEVMPRSVTALGARCHFTDDREVPDTLQVTLNYPGFVATYENRNGNGHSHFGENGIVFYGTEATLFVDRRGYRIIPERRGAAETVVKADAWVLGKHWDNFLECVRTRGKPVADVELCNRTTTSCLLGIVALRSGVRVDWDEENWTVKQPEARRYLSRENRAPWKVTV